MSEYLSKEEIKQWRSSLEKITLEEYAARLGKKIEETKPTNDLIDIVLKGKPVVSNTEEYKQTRTERLSSIAERAYEREREIAPSPFTINKILTDETPVKIEKTEKKTVSSKKATPKSIKKETTAVSAETLRDEVRIVFKKALTDREQKVFDHFVEHKNKIVYAKDLASLLDLPRDYVYKYIKNLRAKIEGENLKNADKGGFILNI
ncbi:MAG: hypothetical protein BHW55_07255 [Candidatus Melainabacteria bacterium 35_41]|jgi:hypothetical protein|nr:MAG: hypothetical protein BHW55_07255 [Candidatus Melainabacteria bacterium 35_41]